MTSRIWTPSNCQPTAPTPRLYLWNVTLETLEILGKLAYQLWIPPFNPATLESSPARLFPFDLITADVLQLAIRLRKARQLRWWVPWTAWTCWLFCCHGVTWRHTSAYHKGTPALSSRLASGNRLMPPQLEQRPANCSHPPKSGSFEIGQSRKKW